MGRGHSADKVWFNEPPLFDLEEPLVNDLTMTEEYREARAENWARGLVADSGNSWETHMAKFNGGRGAVVPR